MNYLLLLGPIGMILVGLLPMIYYFNKRRVKKRLFLWGSVMWLTAIILKSFFDLSLPNIYGWLSTIVPTIALLITSIILGLRTGFFESGITYLIAKKKFKKLKWKDMIAVGLGFGGSEAIIIGLSSLTSFLVIMNPTLTSGLGSVERLMIQDILNQSTLIIFAPWVERAGVLLVHVFATALVLKSLKLKNNQYLWFSIIIKTIIDLPIPYFQTLINQGNIIITYLLELYVVGMGVLSFFGLRWLKKKRK